MEGVDALVAAQLFVRREKVARCRLRCRRQLRGGAQPRVDLLRCEVDLVAVALVTEEDVQGHHAPVRKALGRLREVGRRIEDDRGVLGGQRSKATFLIASTISSSSWSLDRHATAPAS